MPDSNHYYTMLFDENYLVKGLLTITSLLSVSEGPVTIAVLALDEKTYAVLRAYRETVKPKHRVFLYTYNELVGDFENGFDHRFDKLKDSRTHREFCWTLASVFTYHIMCKLGGPRWPEELDAAPPCPRQNSIVVTYIDADLFFFNDPGTPLRDDASIAVVPHRFAKAYKHYAKDTGQYNVSWVSFRIDSVGVACARRWAEQCLKRCDASTCGDQLYLDEWPKKYGDAVQELHAGFGVAPWNVFEYQYTGSQSSNRCSTKVFFLDLTPIVFYHYHEFRKDEKKLNGFYYTGYPIREVDMDVFYGWYCDRYHETEQLIQGLLDLHKTVNS